MKHSEGQGLGASPRGPKGGRALCACLVMLLGGCGGGGDDAAAQSGPTYCEVEPIVERYCLRCHSDPPQNEAPFSLTTWEDIQSVRSRAAQAVADGAMPMVALELDPPVESLPAEEKALLLEWLDNGAPQGTCD